MIGTQRSLNPCSDRQPTIALVLMLLAAVTTAAFAGTYSGGSGTVGNPYQLADPCDWQELITTSTDWFSSFILTDDIDFGGSSIDPIAYDTDPASYDFQGVPFGGDLDGNGYTLSNAVINYAGYDYVGVIGYLDSFSSVQNLQLQNITVTGRDYVGALGYLSSESQVNTVTATGLTISGRGYVGGIAGLNHGPISECSVQGSITSTADYTGGIVGRTEYLVTNCHATIDVDGGDDYAGGITGTAIANLTGCTAAGTVDAGDDFVGGIAGWNEETIYDCHSTVDVTADGRVGGLVGRNDFKILNSHAEGTVIGQSETGGLVGDSMATARIETAYATGAVSGSEAVGGLVGTNRAKLIDTYATGTVTATGLYAGGLVGDNYGDVVTSYAEGAVSGTDYVGGLIGSTLSGDVDRCYATGSADGTNYVGGLIGGSAFSSISQTYAAGLVTGTLSVGGLIGDGDNPASDSFWDTQTTGQSSSDGGLGKTTSEMKSVATFVNAGWGFSAGLYDQPDWCMPPSAYPELFWQAQIAFSNWAQLSCYLGGTDAIATDIFARTDQTINWTITGQDACAWITSVSPDSGTTTGPDDPNAVLISVDSATLGQGVYDYALQLSGDNGDLIEIPVQFTVEGPADLNDFEPLAQYWQDPNCDPDRDCYGADYYADRTIDVLDLALLAEGWLGELVREYPWVDYLEDFSDGLPVAYWSYYSYDRARITEVNGRMRMDCSESLNISSLNEAILHIDLTGQSNVMLSFWQAEAYDERYSLPATFVGSVSGDGVSVSDDGVNWTTVVNADDLDVGLAGQTFIVDLDALGLTYGDDFQIKFQQTDGYAWPSDGREWDNISVYLAP